MKFKYTKAINYDKIIEDLRAIYFKKIKTPLAEDIRFLEGPLIDNFVTARRQKIIGQKVVQPQDLAFIFSLVRDSRWEAFRVIYISNNKVVGSDTYTCRQPGYSCTSKKYGDNSTDEEDDQRMLAEIKFKLSKYEADAFYILHNHPNNISEPSDEDILVIDLYSKFPEFKGQLILGDKDYCFIDKNKIIKQFNYPPEFQKDLPQSGILGTSIKNIGDLRDLAVKYIHSDSISCIIYMTNDWRILAIQEIDNYEFNNKNLSGLLNNQKRNIGACNTYLITSSSEIFKRWDVYKYLGFDEVYFLSDDNMIINQAEYLREPISKVQYLNLKDKKFKF